MRRKRSRTVSIRLKITLYIALFTTVLLAVVWASQVLLLDYFYENTKTRELMSTAQIIERNADSEDLSELIGNLASKTETDIKILIRSGNTMTYIQSLSYTSILNNEQTVRYYLYMAEENGGEYLANSKESVVIPIFPHGNASPDKKVLKTESESRVYCCVVPRADGEKMYILVNAGLTPVDATVATIKNQLVFISCVFIILAVIVGLFISRKISAPIIAVNRSAKKLGEGDYSTHFEGGGYKEISELSDTLNYAAHELSTVDTLRRELIANISHDLRTPLTMITGYSEVMRDIPGENTPENIQVVIDEAEHLRRLVNDIMSLSKLEAGIDTVDMTEYDITESVKSMVNRYSKMKAAEGYDISFEYDEHITLSADELKISQVVYNLVNNALNYTGDDKKVRIIQSRMKEDGEDYVKYEVIDTGIGILPENLEHIWERYYKENRAHKRAGVGTGLGLSIVKGVIELHGGRYGVISSGDGSTFWFALKI